MSLPARAASISVRVRIRPPISASSPVLVLKPGAQVMMQVNDAYGRWVNGTVGRVVSFAFNPYKGEDTIVVEFPGGATAEVAPFKWEVFRFTVDPGTDAVAVVHQ